jgi:hypothetical protein
MEYFENEANNELSKKINALSFQYKMKSITKCNKNGADFRSEKFKLITLSRSI